MLVHIEPEALEAREVEEELQAAYKSAHYSEDFYGDFCFVCGRATDHRGEHTDAQYLAWWRKLPRVR